MRVLVLLNAAAGTLVGSSKKDEPTRIREGFAAQGVEADVREVPGHDLAQVAREASDGGAFDLIIAGGGDGTLNTVAGALVGGTVPFGVLPLGTFNHLAKELHVPLALDAAIAALVHGTTVDFNVGRVNDRHFLSFAAIGIYSEMIKHRDAQRKSRGRKKMWAGTIAAARMLFRWPLKRVRIRFDDAAAPLRRLTPVVFVSLNELQIDQLRLDAPTSDARDALNVFIAKHRGRASLVPLLLRALIHRVRVHRDVDVTRATRCEVDVARHRHVRVGYDGEVETMTLPLRFELVRGGLKMRVPVKP